MAKEALAITVGVVPTFFAMAMQDRDHLPVLSQGQSIATPCFLSRSFSDSSPRFYAIAKEQFCDSSRYFSDSNRTSDNVVCHGDTQ